MPPVVEAAPSVPGPGPGPAEAWEAAAGGGGGYSRPSPGYGAAPPPEDFHQLEKEERGNKRLRQKPTGRKSSRRRRDQIVDDEDY